MPTSKRLAARVETLEPKPARLAQRIEESLTEPDPNVDRARTWLADAARVLRR